MQMTSKGIWKEAIDMVFTEREFRYLYSLWVEKKRPIAGSCEFSLFPASF